MKRTLIATALLVLFGMAIGFFDALELVRGHGLRIFPPH